MEKIENHWIGREGYNCFGCCPTNEQGLRMEFYADGDEVVSVWRPEPHFQSWINTLHGGIQAALADEIAGWTVLHFMGFNAVTAKCELRYAHPVSTTDGEVTLRARIIENRGRLVKVDVKLYDSRQQCCTTGLFTYFIDHSKDGLI